MPLALMPSMVITSDESAQLADSLKSLDRAKVVLRDAANHAEARGRKSLARILRDSQAQLGAVAFRLRWAQGELQR